ncbi:hypothetical protein FM113_11165 [Leucobacter sp. 7(1)]|nr:hypothetical protein FM113_11165 [Leucobacter sp. 7(1)]
MITGKARMQGVFLGVCVRMFSKDADAPGAVEGVLRGLIAR